MESINNVDEGVSNGLVDADTLRDMTLTKQELFDKQKGEVTNSIMSSMISHATTNGGHAYSVQLNSKFDRELLNDIISEFNSLGYKTETEDGVLAGDKTLLLHVSWEEDSNVSDRS